MVVKEKLYTVKQASEILGVHPKTIQKWDREGKIKVVRTPGGRRRIPEGEIKRLLGETTENGRPKCGSKLESRNGLVVCKCGFKSDRQFLGAFNVFVRGLGVALSGGEVEELLPYEPGGELRLMNPKSVVGVDLRGRTFTHNPP